MSIFKQGDRICFEDGQPLIAQGIVGTVPEIEEAGYESVDLNENDWIVHPEALRGIKDIGPRNGCCGPAGCDGPNLACKCGQVLGTEFGDCWMPHFIAIKADSITWKTKAELNQEDSSKSCFKSTAPKAKAAARLFGLLLRWRW